MALDSHACQPALADRPDANHHGRGSWYPDHMDQSVTEGLLAITVECKSNTTDICDTVTAVSNWEYIFLLIVDALFLIQSVLG